MLAVRGDDEAAADSREDIDRDDLRARLDHLTRLTSLDDVTQFGK